MDIQGLTYPEHGKDIRGLSTQDVEWVYGVLIPGISLGPPFGMSLVKELLELIAKINGGYTGSSRPGT